MLLWAGHVSDLLMRASRHGADAEKAEKEAKASAQKEKELGNECYKARLAWRGLPRCLG